VAGRARLARSAHRLRERAVSVERYRRAKELFLSASELGPEERAALLARECAGDDALRRDVEELLGVDARGVPILESPPPSPVAADAADETRALSDADRERLAGLAAARRYAVAGEVSRGGMGVVLRVEDPDLKRELAMKVALGRAVAGTPGPATGSELARFLEEAQITAQLDHPGVAPVHDLGIDAEGRLYFTMKLVRGRDLRAVLELVRRGEEGWNPTRAVGVLLKVCEAMAYAHDKGVVHRDLKPANVMVGAYGEVYVMDWGVARVLGGADDARPLAPVRTVRTTGASETDDGDEGASAWSTRAGAVVGTPYFMPPEQARGEPVGPGADVYAVGAMLYQLLAGRRPYEDPDTPAPAAAVLTRRVQGPPQPVRSLTPDAPAELVAVCERAMAADPAERYPDMGGLAADLRAWLEGRVVQAYESGALAELRKWVGRNRLAASGLSVALVAVVGGLLWSRQAEAASKREIQMTSDAYHAEALIGSADGLWPAAPATVPALVDWLNRARELVGRRPEQERRLAALRRSAGDAGGLALARQSDLLRNLDLLATGTPDEPALIDRVDARLAFARTIEERSVSGPDAAERWADACAAIRAEPAYDGLDLAPQLGLLPLGPDPTSGLWEFVHLETGAEPERAKSGAWDVTAETGLVLVLVPGGTFAMGASADPEGRNPDPEAAVFEGPVRDVTLGPFFLSKYEMTQAQWERCALANPSKWQGAGYGPTNPVEQVSWDQADAVLRRMGLVLPTEARWEYACRAGSDTPFSCPVEDLPRVANLSDRSYEADLGPSPFGIEPFDDGFARHAPVGAFEPNDFGLTDMHGNVFEWTLDPYGSYALDRRDGDGLLLPPEDGSHDAFWSPEYRMIRGGNFETTSSYARASNRVNVGTSFINHALGLRPARDVER